MADTPLFNMQQAKIASLIVDHLAVEAIKVQPSATFEGDLGADSLDMVELTMAFEDEFGVEIADDEAARVTTVQHAFDLIDSKIS